MFAEQIQANSFLNTMCTEAPILIWQLYFVGFVNDTMSTAYDVSNQTVTGKEYELTITYCKVLAQNANWKDWRKA
jgi:hypothetical protein